MKRTFILIFESVHKVFKAEKLLTENHISFDIIPTPKQFSSDCGISIRLTHGVNDVNSAENIFKKNDIIFKTYEIAVR